MIKKQKSFAFVMVLMLLLISGYNLIAQTDTEAQTKDDETKWSLQKVISKALQNDRIYRIAKLSVDNARIESDKVRSYLLPSVTLSASKFYIKESYNIDIPGFDETITTPTQLPMSYGATITMPLHVGGLWPQYLAARKIEISEEEKAELAKQKVIYDSIEIYYGILMAEKGIQVANESVELLEALKKQANDYLAEGIIDKRDVLQAELKLAEVKQVLFSIEKQHSMAVSALNKTVGMDLDKKTAIEDDLTMDEFDKTLEECYKTAETNRPELKQYQAQLEAAELVLHGARQGFLPTIAAFANVNQVNSDMIEDDYLIYGGFQIDFDLYQGGRKWSEVSEASTNRLKAALALDEALENIQLQVKDAYLSVLESEKKLKVAEASVEQARENYRIVNDQYTEHMVNSTDVLDAQTFLTNAKTNHFTAIYQLKISRANLEMALGTLNY